MGLLSIFKKRAINVPAGWSSGGPSIQQHAGSDGMWWYPSRTSRAGKVITADSALNNPTYYRCRHLLASTLAGVPLLTYKVIEDEGLEVDKNHPLYEVLLRLPAPHLTSFEYRQLQFYNIIDYGNAYAQIVRNNRNQIVRLLPISPEQIQIDVNSSGEIIYKHQPLEGKSRVFRLGEIHHLKGPSKDGIVGLPLHLWAKDSIGLAGATEDFASDFFKNGGSMAWWLSFPGKLSPEQRRNFKKSVDEQMSGDNRGGGVVLDQGLELKPGEISQRDAQGVEARERSAIEICKWFGVPPELVGEKTRGSDLSLEDLVKQFVRFGVMPWGCLWEEAIYRDLFYPGASNRHEARFDYSAMLRGDSKAMAELWKALFQVGGITPNEIRKEINLNKIEGGDEAFRPLNVVSVKVPADAPQQQQPAPDKGGLGDDQRAEIIKPLLEQELNRIIAKEVRALKTARKRGDTQDKLDDFYLRHKTHMRENLKPYSNTFFTARNRGKDITKRVDQFVDDYLVRSLEDSKNINGSEELFDNWLSNRAVNETEILLNLMMGEKEDETTEKRA